MPDNVPPDCPDPGREPAGGRFPGVAAGELVVTGAARQVPDFATGRHG